MEDELKVPPGPDVATGAASIANKIGVRNLLIIIVTMPLVFLIVVMAALSIAGKPGKKEDAVVAGAVLSTPADIAVLDQPSRSALAATPASLFAGDPAPLVLPSGGKIGSMALDGDRLVLRVDSAQGGELVVYDLARGDVIQRIKVTKASDEGL